MVAAGISYVSTFLGHGVAAQRRFAWLTLAGGAGTVAAILFSVLLIPGHGLLGAAWAACATRLTSLAFVLAALARSGEMRPAPHA
jgi:O-antigen/teichoic acid export membrane protein